MLYCSKIKFVSVTAAQIDRLCQVYCSVKNISPYWNIVILGQKLGKCCHTLGNHYEKYL